MKRIMIFFLVLIVGYGYAQEEPSSKEAELEEARKIQQELQQQNEKQEPPQPSQENHSAQEKPKSSFGDKVRVGGNLGLSFGNVTFIYLAPLMYYQATPKFMPGFGLIYQHRNDKRGDDLVPPLPDIKTNDYGVNVFARYQVYGPLFVQAEYEYLNYEYLVSVSGNETITDRDNFNSVFLGGGFIQQLGRNGALFISALYNVTYDDNETPRPYDSPWVLRIGAGVGF